MKKFISALIVCVGLLSANASHANCYSCIQIDTKAWGCAKTTETSSGGNYELICEGAGDYCCQFSDGTCPRIIPQATIVGHIREQIAIGQLTGRVAYPGGGYSWNATDGNNFRYQVTED